MCRSGCTAWGLAAIGGRQLPENRQGGAGCPAPRGSWNSRQPPDWATALEPGRAHDASTLEFVPDSQQRRTHPLLRRQSQHLEVAVSFGATAVREPQEVKSLRFAQGRAGPASYFWSALRGGEDPSCRIRHRSSALKSRACHSIS